MHDSGQLPPIYDPTQRPPHSNLYGGGGLHGDDEDDETPEVTPRLLGLGMAVTLDGGEAALPESPVIPFPVHSSAAVPTFPNSNLLVSFKHNLNNALEKYSKCMPAGETALRPEEATLRDDAWAAPCEGLCRPGSPTFPGGGTAARGCVRAEGCYSGGEEERQQMGSEGKVVQIAWIKTSTLPPLPDPSTPHACRCL